MRATARCTSSRRIGRAQTCSIRRLIISMPVRSPCFSVLFFFFNDTATTEIYTLSLHDALPICHHLCRSHRTCLCGARRPGDGRSEEHTSELQSLRHLVCRLLLEKKKNIILVVQNLEKKKIAMRNTEE